MKNGESWYRLRWSRPVLRRSIPRSSMVGSGSGCRPTGCHGSTRSLPNYPGTRWEGDEERCKNFSDMLVYGVAVLAGCFIIGQITGELFGHLLHIDANVGGVVLPCCCSFSSISGCTGKKLITPIWRRASCSGAICTSQWWWRCRPQNAKAALSGGGLAVAAGIIPLAACFALVPVIARLGKKMLLNPKTRLHELYQ